MKNRLFVAIVVLMGLFTNASFAQDFAFNYPLVAKEARRQKVLSTDNEFSPQNTPDKFFFCNPLLLNGQSIDFSNFRISSKGVLRMMHGEPESKAATPVKFKICLRRNGLKVESKQIKFLDKELLYVEISEVLAYSRPGDHLIIKPVNKEDWRAKRILVMYDF